MSVDSDRQQGTDYGMKHCQACGIDYEGECPSCNPRTLYHVEIGTPREDDSDEYEFFDCECGCSDFWSLDEAKRHAMEMDEGLVVVRVCDDNGEEVWATA